MRVGMPMAVMMPGILRGCKNQLGMMDPLEAPQCVGKIPQFAGMAP